MIRFYADHITTDTNVEQRVEIHDSSFGGSEQKMKGVGPGWLSFSHKKLDPKDPFSNPIQKGSLEVTLWVRNAAEQQLLSDILSSDDRRFTLKYVVDSTDEWEGLLLPDLTTFTEDTPSRVTFKARDFSFLDGVDYDLATTATLTRISEIIAECLLETGLTLPIRSYTNLTNSEIVDENQDFLFALYHQKFALRDQNVAISCLEVLQHICRAYNLIIRQTGHRWVIEQLPAVAKGDDVQFDYDSDGLNPVSSTPSRTIVPDHIIRDSVNEVSGALKSITSRYKHRTLIFNIETEDVSHNSSGDKREFDLDFENEGGFLFAISVDAEAVSSTGFGTQGTAYFEVEGVIPGEISVFLDQATGNFSTGTKQVEIDLSGSGGTVTGSLSIEDTSSIPSDVATIRVRFLFADIEDSGGSQDVASVDFTNINALIFNESLRDWDATLQHKYTRSGSYSVTEEIEETLLGDGPTSGDNFASKGRPAIDDFVGDQLSPGNFKIRGVSESLTLEEITLRERVNMRRNPLRVLAASMIASATVENIISYDGETWFIIGDNIDGYTGRHKAHILLLDYDGTTTGDVFQTIVEEGGDPSGAAEGTPASGTGLSLEQADARFFQQSNNLSEGTPATMLTNLGLTATASELNRLDGTLATVQGNLGLSIGVDVQGHSDILDDLSLLTPDDGTFIVGDGLEFTTESGNTARGSLGLGTSDSPTFAGGTFTGAINVSGDRSQFKHTVHQLDVIDDGGTVDKSRWFVGANAEAFDFLSRTDSGSAVGTPLRLFHGGHVAANDGLTVGTLSLSGTETLRVAGDSLLEGETTINPVGNSGLVVKGDSTFSRDDLAIVEIVGLDSIGGIIGTDTAHDLILRANNSEVARATTAGGFEVSGSLTIEGGLIARDAVINRIRFSFGDRALSAGGGKVATVSGTAGSETVTFKDFEGNNIVPVSAGDLLWIQEWDIDGSTVIKSIFRRVASITGTPAINLNLTTDGDMPADTGSIEVNDEMVGFGNDGTTANRDSIIYDSVTDANGPFISIRDGITSYTDWIDNTKIEAQLGNLAGLPALSNGTSPSGFGLYTTNAFLEGTIVSTSGEIAGWTLDDSEIYKGNTGVDADVLHVGMRQAASLDVGSSIHKSDEFSPTGFHIQFREAGTSAAGIIAMGELPSDVDGNLNTTGETNGWYGVYAMKWDETSPYFQLSFNSAGGGFEAVNKIGNFEIIDTLTVTGGDVVIGKGVYTSAALGAMDGFLLGDDTMLISDQGIDIDARQSPENRIEWHDTNHTDDLNDNSNLVGWIAGSVDTLNNENVISLRAQSSLRDSRIIMTSTDVEVNANSFFWDGNIFTFDGTATFNGQANFIGTAEAHNSLVIREIPSFTSPTEGWRLGTNSSGQLIAFHETGTLVVLANP